MTAFLFTSVILSEGENKHHYSLFPAISLSDCKELIFLFDKDGGWAVTQELTVCFFQSDH